MIIHSDKLYLNIRCEIQVFPTTYLTKQNLHYVDLGKYKDLVSSSCNSSDLDKVFSNAILSQRLSISKRI